MPTRSGKSFSVAETPGGSVAPGFVRTASNIQRTQTAKRTRSESNHSEPLRHTRRKRKKQVRPVTTIVAGQVSKDVGLIVDSIRETDKPSSKLAMAKDSGHAIIKNTGLNKHISSRLDSLSTQKKAKPYVYIDLTQDESDHDDNAKPMKRPRCYNAIDGDDSDSRYALTRRKPGQPRKPTQHLAQLSAELRMGEQKDVAKSSTEVHTNSDFAIHDRSTHEKDQYNSVVVLDAGNKKFKKPASELTKPGKSMPVSDQQQPACLWKQSTRDIPRVYEHARAIMFSITEAVTALKRIIDDPDSIPRMSYDLQTGEFFSYPVDRSYHLGAMGRYGASVVQTGLTTRSTSALPITKVDKIEGNESIAHPADFRFKSGCNKGRSIFNVKHSYLRHLQKHPAELEQYRGLREAIEYYWPDGKIRSNPRNRSIQSSHQQ